ncbi:hypothetical protein QNH26_21195 [Peribacillus frigoritolerans]|uniref:hypothetical protein n=1 Tax=Peribacillus frigoritolerans TaxID=450367 RepID=UPI0024C13460|nr:hypothetical protein [Peribacillus frigoritolerans]WHX66153.1 hypothetical protein QNH26_21195 [Peribacillus frigoritolerans]
MFLKRNDLRLIGAEVRDSCGSSGTGETPQAFTPRRLTARPAESEHLEGKSTTLHYLVNSNKVWKNSQTKKGKNAADRNYNQTNWI